MSSGFGHFAKSASGIALRFAAVSMMLGKIEFARTPVPFKSAARQSTIADSGGFRSGIGRRATSMIDRGF
jgi:hypothetical protein